MSLLQLVVRRGFCDQTYQRFALDALPLVQSDGGRRLCSWLLRHYRRYLRGAVDPDRRFRDFQNQIIHVRDGYWGGGPRVAHQWYDRLVQHLVAGRYRKAAHAAGVLSHYFTDPIQPLHTDHSALEEVLHAPIEWSISRAYARIFRRWQTHDLRIVFQLSENPTWLGEAMLQSARYSHRRFEQLLRGYRLDAAIRNPAEGIGQELEMMLAELFGLAISGWARVLERAARDAETLAGHKLPTAGKLLPTTCACVCVPLAYWRSRARMRLQDQRIMNLVDEFRFKGCLEKHLPAEVDIKKRVIEVYHYEKEYRLQRRRKKIAALRLASLTLADALGMDAGEVNRLHAAGIKDIRDLITNHPNYLAEKIAVYWIDADRVALWQRQASLLCDCPDLPVQAMALLAGAGLTTVSRIQLEQRSKTIKQVHEFAHSRAGRRLMINHSLPDQSQIDQWIGLFAPREPVAKAA